MIEHQSHTKKRYPVAQLTANVAMDQVEKVRVLAENNPVIGQRLQLMDSNRIEQEYQKLIEQQGGSDKLLGDGAQATAEEDWVEAEVVEPGEGDPSSMTEEERNLYNQ